MMDTSYKVLARKYRSQDFDSLIGQDVIVRTLKNAIKTSRIAHAYIFTGIRGTGKTSIARILAKALNCLNRDQLTSNPCCKCDNCKAIANGSHIDVLEIDAASYTGVDNMRDILDSAQYRPTNGKYKIYIIDEVHMLSTGAFNALLKTLEEPPEHVIFILATTEIRKVPITTLSRCQRFDLARVSVETLKKHFKEIAEKENVVLEDEANELIARSADGSVRDGLSLLDQAISQSNGNITTENVLSMLKRVDRTLLFDFMKKLLSFNLEETLKLSDDIYNNGTDLILFLTDILEFIYWATKTHPVLKLNISIPYTKDQIEIINEINKNISLNTLSRIWQVITSSLNEIKNANNQKQAFDMLIVRIVNVSNLESVDELYNNIKKDDKPKFNNVFIIKNESDLINKMQLEKEMLLLAYYNNHIQVKHFEENKIVFSDNGNDKTFISKLNNFLFKYTKKQWILEQIPFEEKQDSFIDDIKTLFPGADIQEIKK